MPKTWDEIETEKEENPGPFSDGGVVQYVHGVGVSVREGYRD